MSSELSDKVIIVTGASSGIGRATAIELINKGAKVVLTARRKEFLEEIKGDALVISCDLDDLGQIENLVNKTINKYGRIDVLINVAAVGWYNWIEKLTPQEIKEQYDTNITGMTVLISKVVPYMKRQNRGHIVNISSYASRLAVPPITIYSATKYAVEGLSDALRRELAPWKIKVTRVHPWSVNTDFNEKAASRNGIIYPNKLGVPFMKLTQVTPQEVAKEIVMVIKHPKKAIYVSNFKPLIDLFTTVNHYCPSIVDFVYGFYVRRMVKDTY